MSPFGGPGDGLRARRRVVQRPATFNNGTGGRDVRIGAAEAARAASAAQAPTASETRHSGPTGGCSREDFDRFVAQYGRSGAMDRCTGTGQRRLDQHDRTGRLPPQPQPTVTTTSGLRASDPPHGAAPLPGAPLLRAASHHAPRPRRPRQCSSWSRHTPCVRGVRPTHRHRPQTATSPPPWPAGVHASTA